MTTTILDLTGLKCPLPALKTGKALQGLVPGDQLEVHCTDPMAAIDIPHLVQQQGHSLVDIRKDSERLVFVIEKVAS